jgi:hypothetical protein
MPWTDAARKKAAETRKKKGTVNQYAKAKLEGRSLTSPNKGKHGISRPHTEATKKLISKKALESNHRRLLKSTRVYVKVDGTRVMLDSSWEEALAKRLDEINIKWERPITPLIWQDSSGRQRKYFPDFYLPDFQIYLDPKNQYAFKVQSEKIEFLKSNRQDIIFIHTLKECKEFKRP